MKRDAAQTIFRTVVFAGAMLGTGACAKKQAAPATTPAAPAAETMPAATDTPTPTEAPAGDGTQAAEDPDQGGEVNGERIRGSDSDGGGARGRGFVLS